MNESFKSLAPIIIGLAVAVGIGIGVFWATTQAPEPSSPAGVTTNDKAVVPDDKPASVPARQDSALVRVFGVITDANTGEPIETAQVRARKEKRERGQDVPEPAESSSDASGAYEVRVAAVDYDAIVCFAPGYTRQRNSLNLSRQAELRMDFQLVRGGTVSGKVTDKSNGAPVEGIEIELVGAQENIFERMRGRQLNPDRGARSQADGSYVLDGVPAGSYRAALSMRGTGYLYKPEDAVAIEIEAGRTYDNINFSVERGAELSGRVRNGQTGEPVVKANVIAMPVQMIQQTMRRMSSGLTRELGPDETQTDENGEFHITGLEFDTELRIVAAANGLARGSSDLVQLDRTKAAPYIEITLVRGSKISGVARFPDKTPAAGSRLLLFPEDGDGWNVFFGPAGTRTADDGTFAFENVAAGSYWIRPEGEFSGGLIGRARSSESKSANVETDGKSDVSGVEIIITKDTPTDAEDPVQGTIKGTVLDGSGAPAAEVRVEARQVGNPGRSYGATTATDGTFELAELRGPVFDLSVNAEEGIAKLPAVAVGANVTLKLSPPASLSGFVLDSAGDPVPGCSVRLTNMDEAGKVSSFISVMQGILGAQPGGQSTDANGAFEFTKLAAGSYVLKASSASRGTAETYPLSVSVGEDVTGVQITLSPGVTVSGVVVGPSGEPVRGATVQLGPITQDMAANLVSAFVPSGVLKTAGSTTTNENGEFTINQVAPGSYRLVTSHADFAKSIEPDFSVAAGQDISAHRITLNEGGEAQGTFAIDGKPQAGAMVVMLGEAGVEVVQTDSQGRFDVRGLTAGPHMIAAFDPSQFASGGAGIQFSPQVVDIPNGAPTNITLGGSGVKVTGALMNGDLGTLTLVALRKPDGTPLSGLDLTNFSNLLEAMRSLGSQTVVGPDGAFSLENVPPGSYTLEVYTMNFDQSNPDISALINLPRTPAYSHPIEIGPDTGPLQIDMASP
ncbi:MAG: carboxypeptidase regulatory-like domain-containing protein [Candidatus Hydrogenedentes bacterium]|nr:carboxypeptidase regulatory-like domain-containing protein [Candidatus Hydrogenedentota bacterium]